MDDYGNQIFDIEFLFNGYDHGPFGVIAWRDQAPDMEDQEFFTI